MNADALQGNFGIDSLTLTERPKTQPGAGQVLLKRRAWSLIQSTGGASFCSLQFAKALGARVIATSSSDVKLARVRELGASECINYKTTPEWGDRARAFTGGFLSDR